MSFSNLLNRTAGNYLIRYFSFKQVSLKNNLIIAANPRGGSTWLQNILEQIPHSITLYEPLNPAYAKRFNDFGFNTRPFIPEDVYKSEVLDEFRNLFTGKYIEHRYIFHPFVSNTIGDIIMARLIVHKFCRINLLIPWLTKHLDLRKPILMIRCPFSTIASQIEFANKLGGGWNSINPQYKNLEGIEDSYYTQFNEYPVETQVQSLAKLWCLQNKLVLEHPRHNESWVGLNYEILKDNPSEVVPWLFDQIEVEFKKKYLDKVENESPTTISSKNSNKWRAQITNRDIDNITQILDDFDMLKYYPEPKSPAIDISELTNLEK